MQCMGRTFPLLAERRPDTACSMRKDSSMEGSHATYKNQAGPDPCHSSQNWCGWNTVFAVQTFIRFVLKGKTGGKTVTEILFPNPLLWRFCLVLNLLDQIIITSNSLPSPSQNTHTHTEPAIVCHSHTAKFLTARMNE